MESFHSSGSVTVLSAELSAARGRPRVVVCGHLDVADHPEVHDIFLLCLTSAFVLVADAVFLMVLCASIMLSASVYVSEMFRSMSDAESTAAARWTA